MTPAFRIDLDGGVVLWLAVNADGLLTVNLSDGDEDEDLGVCPDELTVARLRVWTADRLNEIRADAGALE